MSMSLALSICKLFILLFHLFCLQNYFNCILFILLVNGEQFKIIIFFLLFATAAADLFGIVTVALTSIYASL